MNFSLTNQNAAGKVPPVSLATGSKEKKPEKRKDIYLYRSTNVVTIKNIIECPTMKNNFHFETSY